MEVKIRFYEWNQQTRDVKIKISYFSFMVLGENEATYLSWITELDVLTCTCKSQHLECCGRGTTKLRLN